MTGRSVGTLGEEFDSFGAATCCAFLAGVLSLVAPFLTALTGTLVAIAFAGWVSRLRHGTPPERGPWRASRGFALAALGAVVVLVALPVAPVAAGRGLLLGVAPLPLWWVERQRPRGISVPAEDP